MFVPGFMAIHPTVVETFHPKAQNVILMMIEERPGDHQVCMSPPPGTQSGKFIQQLLGYFSLDQSSGLTGTLPSAILRASLKHFLNYFCKCKSCCV